MRARQEHFLWFCSRIRVLDHLFPVNRADTETLNHIFAMYAVHLGTGHSLSCQSLKSGTISSYLLDVANFTRLFDPKDRDPRRRSSMEQSLAPCITKVLAEFKRYETVPNRREPYTPQMQQSFGKLAVDADPDSALAALFNWFGVGLLAGC
jgi:hypothetical protein